MNDLNTDLDRLFAHARQRRVDTSKTEFAFETRLLARLRSERDTTSVWASVTWRLAPIFAACVVALAIWQSQLTSDTDDVVSMASAASPESAGVWGSFD